MQLRRAAAVVLIATVGLMACDDDGDDDDDGAPLVAASVPAATVAPPVTDTADAVTAVATDYRFDGIPESTPAGTQFNLRNDSTEEVHEMIVMRIPDEETRPVGVLVGLPEEEIDAIMGDIQPSLVVVAMPGEAGQVVEGEAVLDEPGRYAVLCFIPTGADPAVLREALSDPDSTGPPEGLDGPPHVIHGMYAEVTVTP